MKKFTRTLAVVLIAAALPLVSAITNASTKVTHTASTVTTHDGVDLYYKDWGPKKWSGGNVQPRLAAQFR